MITWSFQAIRRVYTSSERFHGCHLRKSVSFAVPSKPPKPLAGRVLFEANGLNIPRDPAKMLSRSLLIGNDRTWSAVIAKSLARVCWSLGEMLVKGSLVFDNPESQFRFVCKELKMTSPDSSQEPPQINPYSVQAEEPLVAMLIPSSYSDAIYQQKGLLVMHKQALLPNRCVKSNEPTESRLKRKLYWHHPLVYLFILVNLLIYAIIAIATRKSATIQLPLAERYKKRRILNMIIAWAFVLASIGCLLAGLATPSSPIALLGFLSAIFLLVGILWGLFGCRVIYAKKIDDHFVWIGGVSRDFLGSFPEFPYQSR